MINELIILVVGCLYPAFATYNDFNGGHPCTQCAQRSQQPCPAWVKYWIVFGAFSALHFVTAALEPYVPLLGGFKICLLFWLLPTVGAGAHLVHDELIDPLMRGNQVTIHNAFEGMTHVSSVLLCELVKVVYRLLVDIVEHSWQFTRNSEDLQVTPRLQSAINEVIAELRVARQAASLRDHLLPSCSSSMDASKQEQDYQQEEQQPEQEQPEQEQLQPELEPEPEPEQLQPEAKEQLEDELDMRLRILLAEASSGRRMQLGLQLAHQEHLVPISSSSCRRLCTPAVPPKPRRGKRKS
ncbi:hypothetical protein KR222_010164 [Zaprionus bogoriensis]|nr:hypothetical protein KR222_010164 [Zaprionus bogoriensis]